MAILLRICRTGYIVVDKDKQPTSLDKDSGGYPYVVNREDTFHNVQFFEDYIDADSYAEMFGYRVAKATLGLEYEVIT